jgi:hypothetical protein
VANQMIERLKAHPLVFGGERCITFKQVDEMHERPSGTARKAFNNHRERMTEGKHFYSLPLKDFRQLGEHCSPNSTEGNPNQPVYLLTEKGYTMLVKPLNDDRAWAIQEELVDGYFRVREAQHELTQLCQAIGNLATRLDGAFVTMQALAGQVADLAREVASIKQTQASTQGSGQISIGQSQAWFGLRERIRELWPTSAGTRWPEKTVARIRRWAAKHNYVCTSLYDNAPLTMDKWHGQDVDDIILAAREEAFNSYDMPLFDRAPAPAV